MTTPVDYIAETRRIYDAQGFPSYRWIENVEPAPWTPIEVPLSAARIALVASGGIYEHGQLAFHHSDDTSLRIIENDVDSAALRTTHFAYDLTDARADINCVFPIDGLRTLAARGVIGTPANVHCTFMGGIYSARRVREELAPRVEAVMRSQEVDLVLLVPV